MSVSKLIKRLRREASAHPKKAAILGLLAAGALWFWVPLMWGWVGPAGPTKTTGGKQASAAVEATPVAAQEVPVKQATAPWGQIVAWMERDPRMRPLTQTPGRPDPFHNMVSEAALAQQRKTETEKELEPKAVQPPPDPQSLGMVLSSTVVGSHRRVALVNGKAYFEGGSLVLSDNDQPIAFKLVRVHPKGVVLERDGISYEVNLPEPKWSGRMEVLAGQN